MKFLLTLAIIGMVVFCPGQTRSLNDFIQFARDNNATLKDLQSQVLSNLIDSQILRATTKTQLNFVSNEMYAPVIKGWGYDEIITNIAQVSGMVQATKSFLSKGNLAAQYDTIPDQGRFPTTKWADHPAWKGADGYTDRTGCIVLALLIDGRLTQRGDLGTEYTLDRTEQAFFVKLFCLDVGQRLGRALLRIF